MKRKGFTLIELLAVILILGIIALIAVPAVTNIIDNAKKGAARSSALNYAKAINNQVMLNSMTGNNVISDGTYTPAQLKAKGVELKGTEPTNGSIVISNGEVASYNVIFNGYLVNKTASSDTLTVEKSNGNDVITTLTSGTYVDLNNTRLYSGYSSVHDLTESQGYEWIVYQDATLVNGAGTVRLVSIPNYGNLTVGSLGTSYRVDGVITGYDEETSSYPNQILQRAAFDSNGISNWETSSLKFWMENSLRTLLENEYEISIQKIDIPSIDDLDNCTFNTNGSPASLSCNGQYYSEYVYGWTRINIPGTSKVIYGSHRGSAMGGGPFNDMNPEWDLGTVYPIITIDASYITGTYRRPPLAQ